MAVLLNPLMSEKARGTVSGLTFSNWRGLGTCRRKPVPVKRAMSAQPTNRSILGFLAREWGDLTDSQRAEWANYAVNHPRTDSLGMVYVLTGEQQYISLNHVAMRFGGFPALQTVPPLTDPQAALATLVASDPGVAGQVRVDWTLYGVGDATDFTEVWVAGPFISPGREIVWNRFAYYDKVAGTALTMVVGGLRATLWYHFQVRYADKFGQVTAWLRAKFAASSGP